MYQILSVAHMLIHNVFTYLLNLSKSHYLLLQTYEIVFEMRILLLQQSMKS